MVEQAFGPPRSWGGKSWSDFPNWRCRLWQFKEGKTGAVMQRQSLWNNQEVGITCLPCVNKAQDV
jgi:hypothetical protein